MGSEGGFKCDMTAGIGNGKHRKDQPKGDEYDAEIERLRPQTVMRGYPAGDQCHRRGRDITGCFVHSHGKTTATAADQIDFHDDRG